MKLMCTHIGNKDGISFDIHRGTTSKMFTPGKIYEGQLLAGGTKVIHLIDNLGHERMTTTDDLRFIVRNDHDWVKDTGCVGYAYFKEVK